MKHIFITGNSKGLGLGLTRYYLEQGHQVYGLSRSPCPIEHDHLRQLRHDLADLHGIPRALEQLLPDKLDLVILNAGILGKIRDLSDTPMKDIHQIMDINVWSNKLITDWLIEQDCKVRQMIFISSGASVNGNRGWGTYSISKAAINMMAKLYAEEMVDTHITAYAPGIIHTQMQDYLCKQVDTEKFPSIQNLVNAYNTEYMPEPDTAAANIAQSFQQCLQHESGSFLDIRQL